VIQSGSPRAAYGPTLAARRRRTARDNFACQPSPGPPCRIPGSA